MEKYTNEELLDVLGSCLRESKELTPKQKAVLGQLYVYDGLNKKDKDGYFYRSNKDLCNDCDIKEEKTLIAAVRKLVLLGFIDTVRGSRKDGASLYRLNRKVIDDYCKTPVKEYSNDYSKKIVEMADRIRELENTVKMLVDRITVIETANYSTDTETDKDIDIEKDINNNINNNYNNILEETERIEEVEEGKGEEKPVEYQLVITESLSTPVQNESQPVTDSTLVEDANTSTEEESIPAEHQTIPSVYEQYRQWNGLSNQYNNEIRGASTLEEVNRIRDKAFQGLNDYRENHKYTNEKVFEDTKKSVNIAYHTKLQSLKRLYG